MKVVNIDRIVIEKIVMTGNSLKAFQILDMVSRPAIQTCVCMNCFKMLQMKGGVVKWVSCNLYKRRLHQVGLSWLANL